MADNQAREIAKTSDDPFLNREPILNLVAHITETGSNIPITLITNGILIAGTTISATAYFKGVAQDFDRAHGANPLSEGFRSAVEQQPKNDEVQEGKAMPTYQYIHLDKATTYSAGNPIPASGTRVRIRLASVDGFFFGSLRTS